MSRHRGPLLGAALAAVLAALLVAAACGRSVPRPATGPAAAARPAPPAVSAPPEESSPPTPRAPLPPAGEPETVPEAEMPADAGPVGPIRVRVGLASDLAEVTLPCCEPPLLLEIGDGPVPLTAPARVVAGGGAARPGLWRLQVAALHDEAQATSLADRLHRQTGLEADARFDAGVGLYRVRAGRFAERAEAEAALRRNAGRGLTGAWVTSEGGGVDDPQLVVTFGRRRLVVPGRRLAVVPASGDAVPFAGQRYRGRLLLFVNDRGTLNAIDDVPLEDYLRGVVPREMGPERYARLEALEAQAVAARTYTLGHLGEFAREGYDICATPRCQVYGGMGAEHPLSDRAVEATAGQVLLYRGALIDARYSATCGGHTEDAATVFPLEEAPYLAGVPCIEAGTTRLAGTVVAGSPLAAAVDDLLLPPAPAGDRRAELGARLEHLALLAGIELPDDRLASLDRREVARFVGALLAASPGVVRPASLPLGTSGGAASEPGTLARSEAADLLFALARRLGVVEEETADFQGAADGVLSVRVAGEDRRLPLPATFGTFHGGARPEAAPLDAAPGDRLRLLVARDRLLAVVADEAGGGAIGPDRTAPWTRTIPDAELRRRIEARYPGLRVERFEVVSRGVSGRVGKVRVWGTGGESVDIEGLAIRWTFDLPDTRFTVAATKDRSGRPAWRFVGTGWGHGVGMCQVGAWAMAGRGATYREILQHYYRGVVLAVARSGGGDFDSGSAPPVAGAIASEETEHHAGSR